MERTELNAGEDMIIEEDRLRKKQELDAKENQKPRDKQERTSKKKSKTRRNVFMLLIVFGAILVGFMMFTSGSSDLHEVLSFYSQKTITNSIGMKLVLIPAGEFNMGSPSDESWYGSGPAHIVNIEKPYYLSKYEVTQKQWIKVMGDNPSYIEGDNLPVMSVSWNDVQNFIKKLNDKEGTDKYRLPSEAEWEYAAHAGTTTQYSFGNSESELGKYAWYSEKYGTDPHPVGQKKPNPWGLYDMQGNVWEWVQDEWHDNYYGAPSDGSVWNDGVRSTMVIRGGSCTSDVKDCQLTFRSESYPTHRSQYLGFRLLKEI